MVDFHVQNDDDSCRKTIIREKVYLLSLNEDDIFNIGGFDKEKTIEIIKSTSDLSTENKEYLLKFSKYCILYRELLLKKEILLFKKMLFSSQKRHDELQKKIDQDNQVNENISSSIGEKIYPAKFIFEITKKEKVINFIVKDLRSYMNIVMQYVEI